MSGTRKHSNSVGKVDVYWLNERLSSRQGNWKFFQSSWKTRCRGSNLLRGHLNTVHTINSHRECLEMNLPRWDIDKAYVVPYTFIYQPKKIFEVSFFIVEPCILITWKLLFLTNKCASYWTQKNVKIYIKISYIHSYMFRSIWTNLRELILSLAKVTLL